MFKIVKASLFKLFKDRPFKITVIIGASLAILLTLLNCLMITDHGYSGYQMLLSSSSPTNNFGIAVPINLVTFIIGEFNYGTIRNKIIAGNKKSNIYIALFLMGIIFSFILMIVYIGVSVGLASILCGFTLSGQNVDSKIILSTIAYSLFIYITLSALSLLTATSIRHVGGSITVTVLMIMGGLIAAILTMTNSLKNGEYNLPVIAFITNPLLISSVTSTTSFFDGLFSNLYDYLGLSILSNVIYTAVFLTLGIFIFNKRDVK